MGTLMIEITCYQYQQTCNLNLHIYIILSNLTHGQNLDNRTKVFNSQCATAQYSSSVNQ